MKDETTRRGTAPQAGQDTASPSGRKPAAGARQKSGANPTDSSGQDSGDGTATALRHETLRERDRETTQKRLLETIGELVAECGFEKIGINAVAARSGISKILIYRYFGSVEGLLAAYIRQHDFWINFPREIPAGKPLPEFLKDMFRSQIAQLRGNITLRRLYRWELSADNEMLRTIREQREQTGLQLIEMVHAICGRPVSEIASMATMISASITYLLMLEEFCPRYNGIALDQDAGWEQYAAGIDGLIDRFFQGTTIKTQFKWEYNPELGRFQKIKIY